MNSSPVSGTVNLDQLLQGMDPVLQPDEYVFTTFAANEKTTAFNPIMMFKEAEGTTLIITRHAAESAGVQYEFPCRMITLNIHSALDAVGFLARVATQLASLNMGVNPVAGFYHDHLFIPSDRADDAMVALRKMTEI